MNSNYSYSLEMPHSGQNWRFFVPCNLEIWCMTLENNRAHHLYYVKLCVSFQSHRWIQTGDTVRKRWIRVKISDFLATDLEIGKTPVRIILWCPTTKMLIKACFLIQPQEQEGGCQNCFISLCSKVFINHFYQMKASPECLNILIYLK